MGTCSSVTWPQNLLKKLIEDLVQGKESATQLQSLLHEPFGERGSISAVELADKILTYFTETISVLMSVSDSNNTNNNNNHNINNIQYSSDHDRHSSGTVINGGQPEAVSPVNPHEPLDHHSHCDYRSSGDSGEISKKKPAFKDRRGCYKRRKSTNSWSTVGSTIEDGQAWRKYGQKEILNSEYPRAYFRCTRKHEQGCKATKQVQQIQDNPKMYNTTYIGQHTCKIILKAPQMIVDNSQHHNLESTNYNNIVGPDIRSIRKDHTISSTNFVSKSDAPPRLLLKQEESTQVSEDLSGDKSASFDTDDLWFDFKDAIELSDPTMGLLSPNKRLVGPESDQVDAVDSVAFSFVDRANGSSLISLGNIDDLLVKSIDFGDGDFHFDEISFPIGSA